MKNISQKILVFIFSTLALSLFLKIFSPAAFAIAQEGGAEPGEGLTAVETFLYFFLAPGGLFLSIVVVAYAIHRPKQNKGQRVNPLTEIE